MKSIIRLTLLVAVALFNAAFSQNQPVSSKGLAAIDNTGKFMVYEFNRHAVGDNDILIETMYASICHSDIHHVHEDWGDENYPMVPGHEIVGHVIQVGKNVTKFKVDDFAGVGCMVNSCGKCEWCKADMEQYCPQVAMTYSDIDEFHNNEETQGGYSNNIVVSEKFAIFIPQNADIVRSPISCKLVCALLAKSGMTLWLRCHTR